MKSIKIKQNLSVILLCAAVVAARGQGTAFTYQGRLTDNPYGPGFTGSAEFQFSLWDSPSGGSLVSATNTVLTDVTNGLFTVTLDFGAGVFDGAARWLEIGVRPYGGGAYQTLSPRQALASTPYAIRAANFGGPVSAGQITGFISPSNLAPGSISATMLATGSVTTVALANGAVTSADLADGAVTATKVFSVSNWSMLTLTNPIPEVADQFGSSLAAVGNDRFLIGSPEASKAYLFSFYGRLLHTFADPGPFPSSSTFGSSVAAVGIDRVWIGARTLIGGGANGGGGAYLFTTSGALLTRIINPTPANNDEFGSALAVVGNSHVLIGAHDDDTSATNAGIAYLFNTNGVLVTTFTNPVPVAGDEFGISVAAVGSRVLIGDSGNDTGATNAGAAYLFSTNGTLLTTITNPQPTSGDAFGFTLAGLGTDRVIIGATFAEVAYLFSTSGALLTTFTNPSPSGVDFFGAAVAAMGDDRVLIGAPSGDEGGFNIGAAYLFSTNGVLLATFSNPTPADNDRFGLTLAAVGTNRVLIGNLGNDTGALNAGAAYLFSSETFTPGLVAEGVRPGAITSASIASGAVGTDQLGDGVVDMSKLAREVIDQLVPTGTVVAYAGSNAPPGWELCSGAFRDGNAPAYRALYAVIGKAYGIGDGSAASFNLPDMRGRTAIGLGQGIGLSARALAGRFGTELITQVPNHTHPVNLPTSSAGAHSHTLAGWAASGGTTRFLDTAVASSTGTYTTSTSGAHAHTVTGNTGNPTGGVTGGVDNLQPSLVLNYIIKL